MSEKNNSIYLDYNATTPMEQSTADLIKEHSLVNYGNPSSIYRIGLDSRKFLEESRIKIAETINAEASEIIFTSGGSESDNFAIKGVASYFLDTKKHVVTSSIEHPAVLNTCKYLESKGYKVTYLPVDKYGIVNPKFLSDAITEDTALVSIMHVNNEIGVIEPIKELSDIASKKNVCFHTDAVQSYGKINIDVNELGCDLMSLSAHKVYGPKGIGALYIKKGTRIDQLIHGGHQEFSKRAGTENLPYIAGFSEASLKTCGMIDSESKRLKKLKDALENGVKKNIKDVHINGLSDKNIYNTLSVCFNFIEAESIVMMLDMKGISVSSGSACSSESGEPSHVLKAIGVDTATARGALRFSFGKHSKPEDIDIVLSELIASVKRLREMSPVCKG